MSDLFRDKASDSESSKSLDKLADARWALALACLAAADFKEHIRAREEYGGRDKKAKGGERVRNLRRRKEATR